MAVVWRLADPRFADDLEGKGNRFHGARWNSPGRGVLYCSENLSLSVLETLVHLNPAMRQNLPPRVVIRIEIPDGAAVTVVKSLPKTNRTEQCRKIGDRWLTAGQALVLKAPSVVVPLEHNFMLNPLHPHMRDVRIVERIPFTYDTRFF